MAELAGLVTGEYGRPNAGEIMPMYSPDCAGNKDDALEQNIRDEIMGNKSDRAQAWDYHDTDKYGASVGTYGMIQAIPKTDFIEIPKPMIDCRYVRYRYVGVKGNAYMRLRYETTAIRGHYTHSRLKRAKQAIFVHRSGWDRRLVYSTSKMASIERSKVGQYEPVIANVVKPVAFMRGALASVGLSPRTALFSRATHGIYTIEEIKRNEGMVA